MSSTNPWILYIKQRQRDDNITYSQALKVCAKEISLDSSRYDDFKKKLAWKPKAMKKMIKRAKWDAMVQKSRLQYTEQHGKKPTFKELYSFMREQKLLV